MKLVSAKTLSRHGARARHWLSACVMGLLVGVSACGAESQPPGRTPVDVTLTVWNLSHYPIKGLYVHRGESYLGAANQLSEPLLEQAKVGVPLTTGQYVTAVRDKNLGEEIALTTGAGLMVYNSDCTLIVLNENFQLLGNPDPSGFGADGAATGD